MPFLTPAKLVKPMIKPMTVTALLCCSVVNAQERDDAAGAVKLTTPVPEFSADPNLHRKTNIQLKKKTAVADFKPNAAKSNKADVKTSSEEKVLAPPVAAATPKATASLYFVQVAALKDPDNAVSLLQKVAATKLRPVQLEQADHDGQMTYKVRIGPLADQRSVQSAQRRLEAANLPKGFVVESQQRDFGAP